MERLVLASASPRRKEILRQLGVEFDAIPCSIQEKIPQGVSPETVAVQLALNKARDVSAKLEYPALVMGADTLVVLEGEIMGKPRDGQDAFEMLGKLSGKEHAVITGVALVGNARDIQLTDCQITMVKFRQLPRERIISYINTGEPLDKAGAYAVQGRASVFVERIDGCFFNVVGLPVAKLDAMLCSIGIDMFK